MGKKILVFSIVLIIGLALVGAVGYYLVFVANAVKNSSDIYIDKDDNMDSLVYKLQSNETLANLNHFNLAAKTIGFSEVKTGRYKISSPMSIYRLIVKFRNGQQDPVKVVIQNGRTIHDMIGQLDEQLMADSVALSNLIFDQSFLEEHHVDKDDVLTLFIPNTYEFYWNSSERNVIDKLIKESNDFWEKNNREELLSRSGINKKEAYILASIVEKESSNSSELKTIAGLYLNRIKINMPLQADPTVIFAVQDFNIRRVLNAHLEIDSPYNTYKNVGLPPGPICMPSLNSLLAAIQPENHDYIYMCAKPGYDGRHLFAKTFNQHIINANQYRRWLESEGIR